MSIIKEIEEMREIMGIRGDSSPEPQSRTTVKVRIAVAVGEDGRWNGYGYSQQNEQLASKYAKQKYDNGAVYWLEADLPIPEVTTYKAVVADQAVATEQAPLTDTYVQSVPDKCDRIIWRGDYYHLPLGATNEQT